MLRVLRELTIPSDSNILPNIVKERQLRKKE